jgi:hypothetical protein
MSEQTRSTLKSYFETGDNPTESNFSDLIDSFPLVSETVTQAEYVEAGSLSGSYALLFEKRRYIVCTLSGSLSFTLDSNDARLLQAILIKATGAIEPTFTTPFKLVAGSWDTGAANYIRLQYLSPDEVHYEIYQL